MPPLHTRFHIYCERTSDGLMGEPLNTLSSIAFLVAAWLLWRSYRKNRAMLGAMPEVAALIIIVTATGLGSMIFHSFAARGAVLFDVIPIAFFVFLYLYVFARDLLGFSKTVSWALFVFLLAINWGYKVFVWRAFDGYISYLPTFMFLLGLALYMLLTRHPSSLMIVFASLIAFAALAFRAMDRPFCNALPTGTHFIWHLLNALLLYVLVEEIMAFRRRGRAGKARDI